MKEWVEDVRKGFKKATKGGDKRVRAGVSKTKS